MATNHKATTNNPYLLGVQHAKQGESNLNPFQQFDGKWALYNRGYNSIANPWMRHA